MVVKGDRWSELRAEASPKAQRFAASAFRIQAHRDAAESGYLRGYLAGATRNERRGFRSRKCSCTIGEACSDCI